MRMLNNAIKRYLDRNSRKIEMDSMTSSNTWIIMHIYNSSEDVFQRDLENEFGVTRSTASKALILLEKKGFIKRESVSHDARLKKLTLTEKSLEIAKNIREDGEKMDAQIMKGFSEQELEALYSYLDRIQTNLEEADKSAYRNRRR
jgi:DNA-binding MarR family transcriptional regulator